MSMGEGDKLEDAAAAASPLPPLVDQLSPTTWIVTKDHQDHEELEFFHGLPENFPDGFRVLVVDDDIATITVVSKLLKECNYKVTSTTKAREALQILKQDTDSFDLVLTDVYMKDMDGYTLLSAVSLIIDIPVVLMSFNVDKKTVMKGIRYGARDILVKPLCLEQVRTIWQHVVRKNVYRDNIIPPPAAPWGGAGVVAAAAAVNHHHVDHHHDALSANSHQEITGINGGKPSSEGGHDQEAAPTTSASGAVGDSSYHDELDGSSSNSSKKRIRWDTELHGKFVKAVYDLGGVDKAVPRRILDRMKVSGVSRTNVASHLQQFRKAFKEQKPAESNAAGGGGAGNYSITIPYSTSINPISSFPHTHQLPITPPTLPIGLDDWPSVSPPPTCSSTVMFVSSSSHRRGQSSLLHDYDNHVQMQQTSINRTKILDQMKHQHQQCMYPDLSQDGFGTQQNFSQSIQQANGSDTHEYFQPEFDLSMQPWLSGF